MHLKFYVILSKFTPPNQGLFMISHKNLAFYIWSIYMMVIQNLAKQSRSEIQDGRHAHKW